MFFSFFDRIYVSYKHQRIVKIYYATDFIALVVDNKFILMRVAYGKKTFIGCRC